MIRYAKHNNTSYVIVDSTLKVDGTVVSFQVQVNIQNIEEEDRLKIFRIASIAFNRHLDFNKTKDQPKKSWWQRIFNK